MRPEWWDRYEDALNNWGIGLGLPYVAHKVYEIRSLEGVEQFFKKITETPSFAANHFKLFFRGWLEGRLKDSPASGETVYGRELLLLPSLVTIDEPYKGKPISEHANQVPVADTPKPAGRFESNMRASWAEVDATVLQRAGEYSDTWSDCQWLKVKAIAKRFGLELSTEMARALAAGALCDVKYQRNQGGYKRDSFLDGVAYDLNAMEEVAVLDTMTPTGKASLFKDLRKDTLT